MFRRLVANNKLQRTPCSHTGKGKEKKYVSTWDTPLPHGEVTAHYVVWESLSGKGKASLSGKEKKLRPQVEKSIRQLRSQVEKPIREQKQL